jgi:diaminopropionate ammonia-lyase
MLIDDGRPHRLESGLDTIMAGLACGEPSPVAWQILRRTADCFVTCPDYVAAKGMRIYATPLVGELRDYLQINRDSTLLFINTEGNTDPVHFRQIIWEGANPVPREYWTDSTG